MENSAPRINPDNSSKPPIEPGMIPKPVRTLQSDIAEMEGSTPTPPKPSGPVPPRPPVPPPPAVNGTSSAVPRSPNLSDLSLPPLPPLRPASFTEPQQIIETRKPPEKNLINPFSEEGNDAPEEPLQKPKPILSPIHTYTSDVADAVKNQRTSVASVALAEQEKRRTTGGFEIDEEKSSLWKTIIIGIVSVLLLGGGIALVYFFVFSNRPDVNKDLTALPEEKQLIQTDKSVLVSAEQERDLFVNEINKEIDDTSLEYAHVKELIFTTGVGMERVRATLPKVFETLETNIPPALLRAFGNDYLFGMYSDSGNHPFLIVTVNEYDKAFGGMSEWEKNMIRDLQDIFLTKTDRVQPPYFTITEEGMRYVFADATIKNKEIRVVKNNTGRVVLLYSFIDKKTLVIAADEAAFEDVRDRLVKAKYIR